MQVDSSLMGKMQINEGEIGMSHQRPGIVRS